VVSIHHPVGDVKKISRSFASPWSIDSLGFWYVQNWDEGILESGSTGCAMFNQNGQVSGHYIYGLSTCDTTLFSYFGKFSEYYHLLKPYLGDCNPYMPGLDWEPVIPILVDAAVTSITNVDPLVCGTNVITPRITLKNNGPTVITSVILTYGVAGGIPAVTAWNGSLLPGQTVNHLLPPVQIPPGDHIIEVRSNSPNGEDDDWPFNDKWTLPVSVNSPSHIVHFHLVTDNYGSDITWNLVSENDVVLYEGGPYQDGNNGQYIHVPFCLTNGCYTFTINDLVGDGICCQSGQGDYLLQDDSGHIFGISDGDYGFGSEEVFCLTAVSVPELSQEIELHVFPNPTTGLLNLRVEGPFDITSVQLIDGMGRIAGGGMLADNGPLHTMDLSRLSDGMYMLVIETGQGRVVKRVMLQR
jgi:lysyl endopeptidase